VVKGNVQGSCLGLNAGLRPIANLRSRAAQSLELAEKRTGRFGVVGSEEQTFATFGRSTSFDPVADMPRAPGPKSERSNIADDGSDSLATPHQAKTDHAHSK
jgi:hypothetical protein